MALALMVTEKSKKIQNLSGHLAKHPYSRRLIFSFFLINKVVRKKILKDASMSHGL